VLVATLNTAIDNMLLLVSLPRRSMCFKRMLLVSSLHKQKSVLYWSSKTDTEHLVVHTLKEECYVTELGLTIIRYVLRRNTRE